MFLSLSHGFNPETFAPVLDVDTLISSGEIPALIDSEISTKYLADNLSLALGGQAVLFINVTLKLIKPIPEATIAASTSYSCPTSSIALKLGIGFPPYFSYILARSPTIPAL